MIDQANYKHALRLVRRHMRHSLQATYDPEDFVQDACVAVLLGKDPARLGYIARNRIKNAWRSPYRERRLPFFAEAIADPRSNVWDDNDDDRHRVNLPEGLVMDAYDEDQRAIIALILEGCPKFEIAAKVGCMPYVVQRFLANLNRTCPTTSPSHRRQA